MELRITQHAVRRMVQWLITRGQIESVLTTGETIERYPDDEPYPSRLVLGWAAERPIHVVAADDSVNGVTFVVTVYQPDPALWDEAFRTRREP